VLSTAILSQACKLCRLRASGQQCTEAIHTNSCSLWDYCVVIDTRCRFLSSAVISSWLYRFCKRYTYGLPGSVRVIPTRLQSEAVSSVMRAEIPKNRGSLAVAVNQFPTYPDRLAPTPIDNP